MNSSMFTSHLAGGLTHENLIIFTQWRTKHLLTCVYRFTLNSRCDIRLSLSNFTFHFCTGLYIYTMSSNMKWKSTKYGCAMVTVIKLNLMTSFFPAALVLYHSLSLPTAINSCCLLLLQLSLFLHSLSVFFAFRLTFPSLSVIDKQALNFFQFGFRQTGSLSSERTGDGALNSALDSELFSELLS